MESNSFVVKIHESTIRSDRTLNRNLKNEIGDFKNIKKNKNKSTKSKSQPSPKIEIHYSEPYNDDDDDIMEIDLDHVAPKNTNLSHSFFTPRKFLDDDPDFENTTHENTHEVYAKTKIKELYSRNPKKDKIEPKHILDSNKKTVPNLNRALDKKRETDIDPKKSYDLPSKSNRIEKENEPNKSVDSTSRLERNETMILSLSKLMN